MIETQNNPYQPSNKEPIICIDLTISDSEDEVSTIDSSEHVMGFPPAANPNEEYEVTAASILASLSNSSFALQNQTQEKTKKKKPAVAQVVSPKASVRASAKLTRGNSSACGKSKRKKPSVSSEAGPAQVGASEVSVRASTKIKQGSSSVCAKSKRKKSSVSSEAGPAQVESSKASVKVSTKIKQRSSSACGKHQPKKHSPSAKPKKKCLEREKAGAFRASVKRSEKSASPAPYTKLDTVVISLGCDIETNQQANSGVYASAVNLSCVSTFKQDPRRERSTSASETEIDEFTFYASRKHF